MNTYTDEQYMEVVQELLVLGEEAEKYQKIAKNCMISVVIFALVGIFFFPCLVFAVLSYLAYRSSKGKVDKYNAKMEKWEGDVEYNNFLDRKLKEIKNP